MELQLRKIRSQCRLLPGITRKRGRKGQRELSKRSSPISQVCLGQYRTGGGKEKSLLTQGHPGHTTRHAILVEYNAGFSGTGQGLEGSVLAQSRSFLEEG